LRDNIAEKSPLLLTILSTLFIIAVVWHISYPSNILVFGFAMILTILYPRNPFPLKRSTLYIICLFILIFVFFLVFSLLFHENISYDLIHSYVKKVLFGSIALFIFIVLFYVKRKDLLVKSIDHALLILVSLWMMQLLVYYITGEYIDLLSPIAGAERAQRYQAYFIQASLPIDIIRPTSIFIEPGTYAVNTFPLLVLSYINHNKITKLHVVLLFTYFASMSLFAIIIATLFISISEGAKFKFKLSKKNLFLLFITVLLFIGIEEYLYFRFIQEGNMGAVGLRNTIIHSWLSLDSYGILFGQGSAQTYVSRMIVDDTSFIFKLIFEYGIFAIPYLLLVFYMSWGLPAFFLLIILLTKINYEVYTIWFYFAGLHLLWSPGESRYE